MAELDWLAERFEENRGRLRAVAYRMLGSLSEADDAVQEGWLRLSRSDADEIENLKGWLTTVVGRVCLDMLRSRKAQREEQLDMDMPEPVLNGKEQVGPDHEVLLADSMGLALLIVLSTLSPTERLAFVLHDMFDVSFDEVASIVGCSTVAARQLASRARRRVRGAPTPDADIKRQREVVDAFLAAVRSGDFEGLVAVLDPDVVLVSDHGPSASRIIRGAHKVASQAILFSRFAGQVRPVLVNGVAGVVSRRPSGEPFSVMAFTVKSGKIVEIDILNDPERLGRLNFGDAE